MPISIQFGLRKSLLVLLVLGFLSRASAADTAVNGKLRVTKAAGYSSLRPHVPGHWGVMEVESINSTSRDGNLLVSSYLRGNPYRQYARRIWIPAGARRKTLQPIFLPKDFDLQAKSINIESVVYDQTESHSTDQPMRDEANRVVHSNRLNFSNTSMYTAVISDARIASNSDAEYAINAIASCTFIRYHARRVIVLEGDLPTSEASLSSFRNLVLCSNRIADDAAALQAVRRWVQKGGRLWIMLDRVRQSTVEQLLVDVAPYQEVDRVDLTETQILADDAERWARDPQPQQHDRPVKFVHVVADGVEVTHTVTGWPAAFRHKVGQGEILYTTLGMTAWLRRPRSDDQRESSSGLRFMAREPLARLSLEWFRPAGASTMRFEAFQDTLTQQIGYEVVDRGTVVLVLGLFCIGLLVVFVWLRRSQRMALLLWAGPGLSLATAALFVVLGTRSRQSAREMVALIQIVETADRSEDADITGLMAVYRQSDSVSTFEGLRGGLLQGDFTGQSRTTSRMVWTDFDQWEWADLQIPAGVHLAEYTYSANIKTPISVIGRFGPQGLQGTINTGPFLEPADGVFTTETRLVNGVQLQSDGQFISGPEQFLPPDEFLGGTFLSDEQRRRQDVYRRLWKTKDNLPVATQPTLLIWAKPIDMGFRYSSEEKRVGSALLSIPLRLEQTPPDTPVRIPATFLAYQRVLDPDGRAPTSNYRNSMREWIEKSGSTRNWLRFQLPAQVRPITLEKVTLRVHFDGPSPRLDVAAFVNGKTEILASYEQPSGEVRIVIDRPEVLKLDSQGGLLLGVFVGEGGKKLSVSESSRPGPIWKIEYVRAEVVGKTNATP